MEFWLCIVDLALSVICLIAIYYILLEHNDQIAKLKKSHNDLNECITKIYKEYYRLEEALTKCHQVILKMDDKQDSLQDKVDVLELILSGLKQQTKVKPKKISKKISDLS